MLCERIDWLEEGGPPGVKGMVHVICLDPECKRVIHLDDPSHWNYDGTVACPRCGSTMDVSVRDGKLVSFKVLQRRRMRPT